MNEPRLQILLTNDDGIGSPGLWAAAESLSRLGYVTVVAPREQWTGAGRSMPITSDGSIREEQVTVGGKSWKVYAVGGTPAQVVQHAVLELLPRRPDLVVAGINYGENVTVGVTMSGTVGAALEAAAFGIPSLAISLQTDSSFFHTHSDEIDFAAAAHFAAYFGRMLLKVPRTPDVDLLKVDIPADATPETPWKLTRLSRTIYYHPEVPDRSVPGAVRRIGYRVAVDHKGLEPDSDVYALRVDGCVSVTPVSLDLTSRVELASLESRIRAAIR
ncbi:MAG: 5'/3'-nucleotidase SurE [Anaerolineales bacterium]|nr:5'/3'-nucleotidase SurE [Anaerolineales bacterium]